MDTLNREVESPGSYSPSSPGAPEIQREGNLNMQNDNLCAEESGFARASSTNLDDISDNVSDLFDLRDEEEPGNERSQDGMEDDDDRDASQEDDICIRCQHRVYPTERGEVGVALHKSCFRCVVCNVTLTQHTCQIVRADDQGSTAVGIASGGMPGGVPGGVGKAVYCRSHAPKPVRYALDGSEDFAIKNAVSAQLMNKSSGFNKLIRLTNMSGWQYDAKAMEFEHAKELETRNRKERKTHINDSIDDSLTDIEFNIGTLDLESNDRYLQHTHIPGKLHSRSSRASLDDSTTADGNQGWKEMHNGYHTKDAPRNSLSDESRGSSSDMSRAGSSQWTSSSSSGSTSRDDPSQWASSSDNRGATQDDNIQWKERNVSRRSVRDSRSHWADSVSTSGCNDLEDFVTDSEEYEPLNRKGVAYLGSPRGLMSDYISQRDYYWPGNEERIPLTDNSYNEKPASIRYGRNSLYYNTLKRDPMKGKRYLAQNELEMRQRHEHYQIFEELERRREEQILSLERDITNEMEMAVRNLLRDIDRGEFHGDVEREKENIQLHFRRVKAERMRYMLDKLNVRERMRLDHVVDKQTNEMLALIDSKAQIQLPAPRPPSKSKSEMYPGSHVFDDIDYHAVQVAHHEQDSFTQMVFELTHHCKNQLEKARSIFRWITIKDLNTMMFSENLSEDSPYYFLRGIKYGWESYHELFKRLCSYAGIQVKVIRGVSKSAGYRPGMPFGSHGQFRNSWTAMYLDNNWHLVDCHWGARHISKPRDSHAQEKMTSVDSNEFRYELDEFFFLSDPQDLIYMHYPDDEAWQLMDNPISIEEFEQLPVVKSTFFHYNLSFAQHVPALVMSDTGAVELVLKHKPTDHQSDIDEPLFAFNSRLETAEESLDCHAVHHYRDDVIIFDISIPRSGVYIFTLFACDVRRRDAVYNSVCSIKIQCRAVENRLFEARFPRLPFGYGATPLARKLGLQTNKYDEFYLVCNKDARTMTLDVSFLHASVKISHQLTASGCAEGDGESAYLNRLAFPRRRTDKSASYVMRLPQQGLYVFAIFASQVNDRSPVLDCVCRYLIQCNVRRKETVPLPRTYPKVHPYWSQCHLYEPTAGDLKVDKNIMFKLRVPGASAVAVIVGPQWFYLKREETASSSSSSTSSPGVAVWSGVAYTGKDDHHTLDIYATFGKRSKDFCPLLEYDIVDY